MELLLDLYRAKANNVARLSYLLIKVTLNMLFRIIRDIVGADVACRLQNPDILCFFFFYYNIKIHCHFE